ncbi:response regulator [Treponema sp. HNW]|uniref:response regulator transcription factor n=1 Tax=Treponema sp. HNW TaxID=3116654 RepID=UPI003D0D2BA8
MSRTVIIVDDEKLVLCGISSLITECNSQYEILAACTNAREALKSCIEKSPDLLLTDIGMPEMDGLELISKVKEVKPDIKIAVLSCHDDYELVHKAFLAGACDYILKKDIDKNALEKLFTRIFPASEQDNIERKKKPLMPVSDMSAVIPENPGTLAIIRFKSEPYDKNTEVPWYPDIPMLCQLIHNDIHIPMELFIGEQKDLVLLLSTGINRTSSENIGLELLRKIRVSVSKYINRRVFIAYYPMSPGQSIVQAYNQALQIVDTLFYKKNSAVLTEKTQPAYWDRTLTFAIDFDNSEKKWVQTLNRFFYAAREKRVSSESVKAEAIFAVKHLLHCIRQTGREDISEKTISDGQSYYRRIMTFDDWEELRSWLENVLLRISHQITQGKQEHKIIFNIKAYINSHLESDLRLVIIADMFGINPNYLSTVFKKNVHKNYTDYVNEKRIRYALELIKTTNLSAKEIAYKCGYANPNYFSRIFRKITKTTITQYQKKDCENCEL